MLPKYTWWIFDIFLIKSVPGMGGMDLRASNAQRKKSHDKSSPGVRKKNNGQNLSRALIISKSYPSEVGCYISRTIHFGLKRTLAMDLGG